ncbi:uncharacterized protein J4E87_000646 [Alternaria ethzedia]|uniref:uncharacterized protein n=1 Tax=Alternaria ethzedia TaxID=181014 RepID=UPI0020C4A353|nr:uncharacterized protein J4E87_000646 [Alternaria ethzedia]KAI4635691.1 hypothetical protein J4E87_000646 [Alternaria ethzedia]
MALLELADELLALIVDHTIPEGFESLCLSCRKFHTLCKPLLKHHNELRSHFRNFDYLLKDKYPSLTIRTPFELIARIAEEPVVARYIEHADFKADLRLPVGGRLWIMERDGYRPETVRDLFASSKYLSGNEWQDYFEKYERGLEDNLYTQAASSFLLTLLPNVKTVVLPFRWTHDKETDKLFEAIVHHARQPNVTLTNASLALVTTLKTGFSYAMRQGLVLNKITPLLALPRIHTFHGPTSISDIEASEPSSPRQSMPPPVGGTLEVAYLRGCNLDGPAMQHFLRYTPRLKTLVYSHSDKQLSRVWDICDLVTTIGKEAGSHLEELSITKREFSGKIALGTATMRDFPRLHKLEIPLDLATCVIRSAAHLGTDPADQSHVNLLMCGLVPASVTRLFLTSEEYVILEPATVAWNMNIGEADFVKPKGGFELEDQDDEWRMRNAEESGNDFLFQYGQAGTRSELYIVHVKSKNVDCNTGALPEYDLNDIWDHGAAALSVDEQGQRDSDAYLENLKKGFDVTNVEDGPGVHGVCSV